MIYDVHDFVKLLCNMVFLRDALLYWTVTMLLNLAINWLVLTCHTGGITCDIRIGGMWPQLVSSDKRRE